MLFVFIIIKPPICVSVIARLFSFTYASSTAITKCDANCCKALENKHYNKQWDNSFCGNKGSKSEKYKTIVK